jgi:hypothetical protein
MADFNALLGQAATTVSHAYPGARLGEISFWPKDRSANQAEDMTTWNFVFSIPRNQVTISLQDGRFNTPQLLEGGLFSDRLFSPPLNKSLGDAFAILRQGGYADPVTKIKLCQALNFAPSTPQEPCYLMELANGNADVISVGASSGQLTVVVLPTD